MAKFTRSCELCGTLFETEWETKSYCSRSHKEQAREQRKRIREGKTKTQYDRKCIGCGTDFITTNQAKVYCTSDCQRWVRDQLRQERDRHYRNQKTQPFKNRLYWRDKGLCGICHQPIDTALTYPHPMSFSIDHIIPRSVKPDHTFNNLRSTHLKCNMERGNKPA